MFNKHLLSSDGMKKIIIPILVLILLIVAYFVWNKATFEPVSIDLETKDVVGMKDIEIIEGLEGFENIQIGFAPLKDPGTNVPDLNREVKNLTEASLARLDTLIENLEEDPLNINEWIEIGGFWKVGGAFEGASEAWQYALDLAPTNTVALVNLGNLYTSDIIDLDKAESWYMKAIEANPQYIPAYFKGAEMYLYGMKDRNKAIKFVEKGLETIPLDGSLQSLKEVLESGGSL